MKTETQLREMLKACEIKDERLLKTNPNLLKLSPKQQTRAEYNFNLGAITGLKYALGQLDILKSESNEKDNRSES